MKKLLLFFPVFWLTLFILTPTPLICQTAEINKQIVTAITAGNAAELAKYFNTMIDLSIPGKEETYSKTQATMILQDFFLKYAVKSYKTNKQGNSNDGSQFSIGRMESGNKAFRVYYLIKKSSDNNLIHQFQIQEEN